MKPKAGIFFYGLGVASIRSISNDIDLNFLISVGFEAKEIIQGPDNLYFALMFSGHEPSKMEFNQAQNEDFELLKRCVKEKGSAEFKGRLETLEKTFELMSDGNRNL